jgi:hypothetical protein
VGQSYRLELEMATAAPVVQGGRRRSAVSPVAGARSERYSILARCSWRTSAGPVEPQIRKVLSGSSRRGSRGNHGSASTRSQTATSPWLPPRRPARLARRPPAARAPRRRAWRHRCTLRWRRPFPRGLGAAHRPWGFSWASRAGRVGITLVCPPRGRVQGGGEPRLNPSRFGIRTCGNERASSQALSVRMPFRKRTYAETA